MQITNPRIESKTADIAKTKAKIAVLQTKMREQEKQLRALEDTEIVAKFRNERLSDNDLNTLYAAKPPKKPAATGKNETKEVMNNANTEEN
jgi:hypothetical protein